MNTIVTANPGARKESSAIWNILGIVFFGRVWWDAALETMAPLLRWWDLEFRKTTAGFDFFEGFLGLIGWRALLRISKSGEGKYGRKRRGQTRPRVSSTPAVPYTYPDAVHSGSASRPTAFTSTQINQRPTGAGDITSPWPDEVISRTWFDLTHVRNRKGMSWFYSFCKLVESM